MIGALNRVSKFSYSGTLGSLALEGEVKTTGGKNFLSLRALSPEGDLGHGILSRVSSSSYSGILDLDRHRIKLRGTPKDSKTFDLSGKEETPEEMLRRIFSGAIVPLDFLPEDLR